MVFETFGILDDLKCEMVAKEGLEHPTRGLWLNCFKFF